MPCGPDTTDPIAEALFRTDGLILLGRGFPPAELSPGDVIRQPSHETARDVVLDKASRLFTGMVLEPLSGPYERLGRGVRTRVLDLSTAAELSPTFTGAPGPAEAEAVLAATGSRSFEVCFVGAQLASIDLAALEAHLASTDLTELGAGYLNDGQRLLLVTGAVKVSGAVIQLDVSDGRQAKLAASQESLGRLGLRGSVDLRQTSSVKLEPVAGSVVIAVRLIEIALASSGRLELRGVRRPVTIRGNGARRPEPTLGTAEVLGLAGPFLDLPRP